MEHTGTYQRKSTRNPARTDLLTELPIHDYDLEQQVIAILLHAQDTKQYLYKIDDIDFYKAEHKDIFAQIKEYVEKNGHFDYHNMSLNFKDNDILRSIYSNIVMFSLADGNIERLKDITAKRQLQYLSNDINIQVKENKELYAIKSNIETILEDISLRSMTKYAVQNKEVEERFLEMLNHKIEPIDTGFNYLNEEIGGLYPGYFMLIGGIPGVGKSSYMFNIMHNALRMNKKVLFVSLEMPFVETHAKLISEASGIPLSVVRGIDKDVDMTKIMDALAVFSEYRLYRIGEQATTVYDIENNIRQINGIDIVFIDYLQRLSPDDRKASRYEQVSQIARDLKMLANKFKIPVISIVSINRGYEQRTDHRPRLADFRESGNLEFDCDIALMLHRPAMFPDPKLSEQEYINLFDITEVNIAKNRYGKTGAIIEYEFKASYSKFIEKGYKGWTKEE